jgi:hypothetical protein
MNKYVLFALCVANLSLYGMDSNKLKPTSNVHNSFNERFGGNTKTPVDDRGIRKNGTQGNLGNKPKNNINYHNNVLPARFGDN